MELSQNEVDSLAKEKRIDEAISEGDPLADPIEPLMTFRKFIDNTRKQIGDHYGRVKDKEIQIISLHKKTVFGIQKSRRISKEAIDFFKDRKSDYEAMINLVLKGVEEGRIVKLPSFGSDLLK